LERTPSILEFGLSICLVWAVSASLDGLSPDLGLFWHIFWTVLTSAFIWRILSTIFRIVKANHLFFKQHENEVNSMIAEGFSVDEIARYLNEKKKSEIVNDAYDVQDILQEEQKINYNMFKIVATSDVCGYYQDKPIYSKLLMADGSIYRFDGILDLTKEIPKNIIKSLNDSSIVLNTGQIYTLDI
jgi:hypothetical protein